MQSWLWSGSPPSTWSAGSVRKIAQRSPNDSCNPPVCGWLLASSHPASSHPGWHVRFVRDDINERQNTWEFLEDSLVW